MTDMEIKKDMMENHFTESGADKYVHIKNEYPTLLKNYEMMMGNFGFTEKELIANMPSIKRFLREHDDYFLLYQNNACCDNEDEEPCWWLTYFN